MLVATNKTCWLSTGCAADVFFHHGRMAEGAKGAGQAQAIKAMPHADNIGLVCLDKRVENAVRIGSSFHLHEKLLSK